MTTQKDFNLIVVKTNQQFELNDQNGQLLKRVDEKHLHTLLEQTSAYYQSWDAELAQKLGHSVYESFLAETPFEAIRSTSASTRLLIHTHHAPEIEPLPWELLYDGSVYLGLTEEVSLLRVRGQHARPLQLSQGPIRILITLDSSRSAKDEEAMLREIEQQSDGLFKLTILRQPNALNFQRTFADALHDKPFHIWHHLGKAKVGTNGIILTFPDSELPITRMNILLGESQLKILALNLSYPTPPHHFIPTPHLPVPLILLAQPHLDPFSASNYLRYFYLELLNGSISSAVKRGTKQAFRLSGDLAWSAMTVTAQTDADEFLPSAKPLANPVLSTLIPRDQVFISYSHQDAAWMEKLLGYLAPLRLNQLLKVWSDKDIQAGADWFSDIQSALARAKVVVILASRNFLASPFIHEQELPYILTARAQGQLTVIWVAVSAYLYDATPLKDIQAVSNPSQPLDRMDQTQLEDVMIKIVRTIQQALGN